MIKLLRMQSQIGLQMRVVRSDNIPRILNKLFSNKRAHSLIKSQSIYRQKKDNELSQAMTKVIQNV